MTLNIIKRSHYLFKDKETALAFVEKNEKFHPGFYGEYLEILKYQINNLELEVLPKVPYDQATGTDCKWLVKIDFHNEILFFKDAEFPHYIRKECSVSKELCCDGID